MKQQGCRARQRQRAEAYRPAGCAAFGAVIVSLCQPAAADVSVSVGGGVPLMIVPQFLETGAPTFTTPTGSSTETPAPALPTQTPSSGGDVSVASGYSQYLGTTVGSGQCVALLQAADPSVGLTETWAKGDAVQGNTSLQPGTAIATFGPNGNYTNSLDGSSHAAIYLGQNAEGIQVQDQWVGQVAHVRTIPWTNAYSAKAANNASSFYVVSH